MKSLILMAAMLIGFSAHAQQFGNDWDRGGRGDDRGGWGRGDDRGGWDRPGRPGGPGRPGPGWPGGDRTVEKSIRCESQNRRPAICNAGGQIVQVLSVNQISSSTCNNNYSIRGDEIYVDNGCRADFRVVVREGGRPGPGPGPGPGPRPPSYESIRCASQNYRFASCAVNGMIDYIEIERQVSRSSCQSGVSYGYNNQSIWVDKGCEAIFRVYYRRW